MKNTIMYYYELEPKNIHQVGKKYYFFIDNEKYYFVPFNRPATEAEGIYKLNIEMLSRNMLVHEIILNKRSEIISMYHEMPFILMKLSINDKGKLKLSDLDYFAKSSYQMPYDKVLEMNNWSYLWGQKIDYLEYQMTQMGKNYPILRESFSYFLGMAENAIAYVGDTMRNVKLTMLDGMTLSHRRISHNLNLYDFYNPLNIVVDHKARDLAEYVKSTFFEGKFSFEELEEYFKYNMFSVYGYQMFFGRLLLPTYYFDIYERVMSEKESEKKILNVISKVDEYEELLYDIYYFIKKRSAIKEILWITKK